MKAKVLFVLSATLYITISGCALQPRQDSETGPSVRGRVAKDPVAELSRILPAGWVIDKVEKNTHPWLRVAGRGLAVYIDDTNVTEKWHVDAVVFVMPFDYSGSEYEHRSQLKRPRLIALTDDAKIYMWGGRYTSWRTLERDILAALIKLK
jgi:hypothetical protein